MDFEPNHHEKDWVEQAKHDVKAFTHLYNHYFPRLYAYVSYRVGRAHDCEDIVADTFVRVVEGLPGFEWRHSGAFAAWLFRIARNLINDRYRQRKRQGTDEILTWEELPELEDNALLPDEVILQKEQFARLYHLVGELPGRRQEVITLKFFGELRNREIAEVLGLDERTVASHLYRGLQDLNRLFASDTSGQKGDSHERARR